MKNIRLALLFTLAAVTTAVAADAPYIGKWKLNSSKSQLNGAFATIEKLPSGEFRFAAQGFVYNFRLDGKEYPMPDGGTTSWKALGADSWEVTNRANGKVNATIKLTVKGDTLSSMAMIPQPDGKDIMQTSTSKRVSGGPGLPGKWQEEKEDAGAIWLEFAPNGPDGVKISSPNSMCAAKFDGKPYPMTGSGDGSKTTMAFRKTGPASLETTTLMDGKPFATDVYTVSADGKILTDNGTSVATKESQKAIFERQ